MTFNEINLIGLSILSSLGGSTIILFAFSSWLGKVWANRILEQEKSKYMLEMEIIKTKNQNYINAFGVSNSAYIDSRKAFNNERIQAIKLLWSALIKIKNSRPSPIIFLDILTFGEYQQLQKNSKFNFFDTELSSEKIVEATNSNVDDIRPFVDNKAFSYFWVYRTLIGRLAIYVKKIREEGQPKQIWREESGIVEILKAIFSAEDIQRFQEEKWDTTVLLGYIETELVNYLQKLASGADIIEDSLEHSINLYKSASALEKLSNSET